MKKTNPKVLIVSIIILILALTITACGNSSNNTSKCTICGKNATNTFQGSGYCSKHYQNAVKWAIDNVAERDN